MKTIKFLAISFVIVSLALTAFADSTSVDTFVDSSSVVIDSMQTDSTTIVTEPVSTGFFNSFSVTNLFIVIVGLLEIFVRLYPTEKNYSILSLVNSIINFLLPNFKKDGGKH